MKIFQDFNFKILPLVILSAVFIYSYFKLLHLVISGQAVIPANMKDVALLLIGIITREIPTIMQFWFGSSHGSKQKTTEGSNGFRNGRSE